VIARNDTLPISVWRGVGVRFTECRCSISTCLCVEVKGGGDSETTHGVFAASVAVLRRSVPKALLTGRKLRSDSLYLAQTGTKVTTKQGTVNITIQLLRSFIYYWPAYT